jgi:hypothetical protein
MPISERKDLEELIEKRQNLTSLLRPNIISLVENFMKLENVVATMHKNEAQLKNNIETHDEDREASFTSTNQFVEEYNTCLADFKNIKDAMSVKQDAIVKQMLELKLPI